MPHLIVEYSSNLPDFPEREALAALNAAVCASPEVAAPAAPTLLVPPVPR